VQIIVVKNAYAGGMTKVKIKFQHMKRKDKLVVVLCTGAAVVAGLFYFFRSEKGGKIRKEAMARGRQIVEELKNIAQDFSCKTDKKTTVS